jgi:hypothetical protein
MSKRKTTIADVMELYHKENDLNWNPEVWVLSFEVVEQ